MHNWFPVTRGHYKESSVIGMGWGQWRTRSVSLTKVSHSPDHDPHTYHTHTRTRTCPSRRVASSVSSSRTYSYTIFHELDLSLHTFSSSYLFLFLAPFIILIILSLIFLIHRLLPNPTILHPLFPSSPIYTAPPSTHNLSLTPLLTLYSSSLFILPVRLLSLLFVLTSTNSEVQRFLRSPAAVTYQIQPWRLLVEIQPAQICASYK